MLIGEQNLANFTSKYQILTDVYLRLPAIGEEVDYTLHNEIPIPLGAIIEGGLRFPLHALLRQVLNHYNVHSNDFTMNAYRTVIGIVE